MGAGHSQVSNTRKRLVRFGGSEAGGEAAASGCGNHSSPRGGWRETSMLRGPSSNGVCVWGVGRVVKRGLSGCQPSGFRIGATHDDEGMKPGQCGN